MPGALRRWQSGGRRAGGVRAHVWVKLVLGESRRAERNSARDHYKTSAHGWLLHHVRDPTQLLTW